MVKIQKGRNRSEIIDKLFLPRTTSNYLPCTRFLFLVEKKRENFLSIPEIIIHTDTVIK